MRPIIIFFLDSFVVARKDWENLQKKISHLQGMIALSLENPTKQKEWLRAAKDIIHLPSVIHMSLATS